MKYALKTTLALLFAGVINLAAQTHDEAISVLRESPTFSPASTESAALRALILEEPTVSDREAQFVIWTLQASNAPAADIQAMWVTLAGKGSLAAQAAAKLISGSFTGWTVDMILAGNEAAATLARREGAPADFKQTVFSTLVGKGFASPSGAAFFKEYRATLPPTQQLEVTALERDGLLKVGIRSPQQDAYLASIAADLIALQLGQ